MHIITDENGNPCAHTHDHGHTHTHEACGQDSCGECHECGQETTADDKNAALLTYMYQHNQSHAAELDQMAAKLQQEGMEKAAAQIRIAVDEFQKGNMYLKLALAMVKEGQQEG